MSTAVQYVRAEAATLGVDSDRIALMGDSAGAHLSAVASENLCPLTRRRATNQNMIAE
jgi:acetyl esterase/lipase